ncbi:hypothetical protein BH18ACT1_BH18ACT1_01000 [soil metagenome]
MTIAPPGSGSRGMSKTAPSRASSGRFCGVSWQCGTSEPLTATAVDCSDRPASSCTTMGRPVRGP